MRLLFGQDEIVARWVAQHIPTMQDNLSFGPCTAIGVVDERDNPLAGVVFSNYRPEYRSIEISCAAVSSRWLTKRIASLLLAYPFAQLGVGRLSATTPRTSGTSASQFLRKFGFRQEGVIRRGLGDDDALVWGLLSEEWARSKFNVGRVDVKKFSRSSDARRSRRARQRSRFREHCDGTRAATAQHGGHVGS